MNVGEKGTLKTNLGNETGINYTLLHRTGDLENWAAHPAEAGPVHRPSFRAGPL